jgi:hypothetical protein
MADFENNAECFVLDTQAISKLPVEPFTAAERHAISSSSPTTVTGLHLSMEAYMGIGDRVPRSTPEKVSEAMAESILDDIDPHDIGSSIDDIKYGPNLTPHQLSRLKDIVKRHRAVWEKTDGVVDEPPEDWLKIKLKKDANLKSKGVYRLGVKDRAVVDDLLDKLIAEGKMSK